MMGTRMVILNHGPGMLQWTPEKMNQEMAGYLGQGREISGRDDAFSRRLAKMSDQELRRRLLKKLMKRKTSGGIGSRDLLYGRELIEEASRRGIPTGLPVPVAKDNEEEIEKKEPETYETAREHIKAERFEQAVKILWKLKCNAKYSETEDKAGEEGDWFTIAALRFFNAAGMGGFNSYLNAFRVVESLNGTQARAFFKEVVEKKHEFYGWDTEIRKEEPIRLAPLRNDIADAKMKAYARARKRKMLDSALSGAEQVDDTFSKSEALREVALAFEQSRLARKALDIFRKAEDALTDLPDSDEKMYELLMARKEIASAMAKAGMRNETYALFKKTAEIASPFRSYHYDNDRIGVEALIEIGLAQWKANLVQQGVEKTFQEVHNIIIGAGFPNDHDSPLLRTRWGAAYAKMDPGNADMIDKAVGQFEKAAEELFELLGRESLNHEDHHKLSEIQIGLVCAMADAGMTTKAYEYLDRGIDRHDLESFPILCAKGHVAIGAAYLKTALRDRATTHFNHAIGYMKEDGPSRQSAEMLAQMGLVYAEAGLDMKARRKFELSAIEADKLSHYESSMADIQRISTYLQAAKNDGFLSGLNRRIMYEALCVHANNIKEHSISVKALLHIAAAQREEGMERDARATLEMAEERTDFVSRKKTSYDPDRMHGLLAEAWAEFGSLRNAKEYASRMNDRKLFAKASAAIAIARARRAAGIDAGPLSEREMELLQKHTDDESVLGETLVAEENDKYGKKAWRSSLPLRSDGSFWPPDQWGPSQPFPQDTSGSNVRRVDSIEMAQKHTFLRMEVLHLLTDKSTALQNAGIRKVDIKIRITPQDAVVLQSLEPKEASPIIENELRRKLSSNKDIYVEDLDSGRNETLELHFEYTL